MDAGIDEGANRGRWLALAAALLGWMFDGLEMGLFPLVARPALMDLLQLTDDQVIGRWIAVATAEAASLTRFPAMGQRWSTTLSA